eukprot:177892_1
MLYEQGSRVMQIVRYPPKFQIHNGNGPYVVSDNLIVSHVDIAPVFFDLAGIDSRNYDYVLDGKNWVTEVQSEIYGNNKLQMDKAGGATKEKAPKEKAGKKKGAKSKTSCCTEKYMDMYNSHSIITQKWKYIFRATEQIETDSDGDLFYPYVWDTEQLYNLKSDQNEPHNLIGALANTACYFKEKMVQYINDVACPINGE